MASSLLRANPSLLFALLLNPQILRRCIQLNRRDQGHVEQLCAVFIIEDDQQSASRINERMIRRRDAHGGAVARPDSEWPIRIKSFAQLPQPSYSNHTIFNVLLQDGGPLSRQRAEIQLSGFCTHHSSPACRAAMLAKAFGVGVVHAGRSRQFGLNSALGVCFRLPALSFAAEIRDQTI